MAPKSDKQRKLMGAICKGGVKKKGLPKATACEILHGKKKKRGKK